MRIAQIAPLFESVPPKSYGGTERVVSYLTEELVALGHDITLFASGDSQTRAKLEPTRREAIRLDKNHVDAIAAHVLHLERVLQRAHEFDVLHFHVDHSHFPVARRENLPQLTTMHNRLDIPDLSSLFSEFRDMPVVSISNSQRRPLPQARWLGTVYHGLPRELHHFRPAGGDYYVFVGRVSPEKGLDRAIRIAQRTGRRLKIAAKLDPMNLAYYEEQIRPLLANRFVEFIGEVGDEEKDELMGGAYALLFPVRWPEPFGLVMIESLACGTPVLAYGDGSVPEVIEHGVTGFVVADDEEAVDAAGRMREIDRRVCREQFERRFSAQRMARDYVALYEKIIQGPARMPGAAAPA